MAEYRREPGSKAWHWRPACSGYPTRNFEIRHDKPADAELCNHCTAIAREKPNGR